MPEPQTPATDAPLPMHSGRYAIIVIALFAIGGAGFNWWYQRNLHHRSIALWGTPITQLILNAPEVEALRLAPSEQAGADAESKDAKGESIEIDGKKWTVIATQRIETPSQAPGSSHLRRSLVNDRSFDWQEPLDACQPDWAYALRFRQGQEEKTFVIALDCPRVALLGTELRASIRPMTPALTKFFSEQFAQ